MLARGVIAHGPIDSVDATKGRLVVLGKTLRFGGSVSQINALANRLATGEVILATVTGSRDKKGTLQSTSILLSDGPFVPGSTDVMIVGPIKAVESATGTIILNGLRIDYSALLSSGQMEFRPGQVVAAIGVRVAPNMPLIASTIKVL